MVSKKCNFVNYPKIRFSIKFFTQSSINYFINLIKWIIMNCNSWVVEKQLNCKLTFLSRFLRVSPAHSAKFGSCHEHLPPEQSHFLYVLPTSYKVKNVKRKNKT